MYTKTAVIALALVASSNLVVEGGCPTCNSGGNYYAPASYPSVGYVGSSYGMAGYDMAGYGGMMTSSGKDQLYPFDIQYPWVHGYIQQMPAYGGFHSFRPYNYQHVIPQVQTAAGWGLPTGLAFSQQWWHRYQQSGAMRERLSSPNPNEYTPRLNSDVTSLRTEIEQLKQLLQQQQTYAATAPSPGRIAAPNLYSDYPQSLSPQSGPVVPAQGINPAAHQQMSYSVPATVTAPQPCGPGRVCPIPATPGPSYNSAYPSYR